MIYKITEMTDIYWLEDVNDFSWDYTVTITDPRITGIIYEYTYDY